MKQPLLATLVVLVVTLTMIQVASGMAHQYVHLFTRVLA